VRRKGKSGLKNEEVKGHRIRKKGGEGATEGSYKPLNLKPSLLAKEDGKRTAQEELTRGD